MNKYAIISIILLVAVGCKSPSVITNTETKWRDTTIYVDVPVYIDKLVEVPLPVHDTLKIAENVYIGNQGVAEMKPVHREKGIIGADISISGGKLKAELYLTDSAILFNYRDTLNYEDSVKIYNAIKETKTETAITKKERFVPKYYKFTSWVFIVMVILGAGIVVYKIKGDVIKTAIKGFLK